MGPSLAPVETHLTFHSINLMLKYIQNLYKLQASLFVWSYRLVREKYSWYRITVNDKKLEINIHFFRNNING